MKPLFTVLFLLVFLATACGPDKEDAIAYNDQIIALVNGSVEVINDLDDGLKHWREVDSRKLLADSRGRLEGIRDSLKALEPFKKDKGFRDASVQLVEVYLAATDAEYAKLFQLYALPDSLYGDAQEKEAKALLDDIEAKFLQAEALADSVQLGFASAWDFKVNVTE